MVSYDWADGGSVGAFFWDGMISCLWGELVLFQAIGVKIMDEIVLQGYREG